MRWLRILAGALLTLAAGAAAAQDCVLPAMRTDARPPIAAAPSDLPAGAQASTAGLAQALAWEANPEPTQVTVAMLLLDVLGVDDANQAMELDLWVTATWRDPRLTELAGCRFPITQVWFPPVQLVNSASVRLGFREARNQVAVEPGGMVRHVQRITGRVTTYHALNDFPFDRQAFVLDFVSPELDRSQLVLVPDAEGTDISHRLGVEGWTFQGVSLSEQVQTARLLGGEELSRLSLVIFAERVPTYYTFRVLLPLFLVVAMSWAVFWVPAERFEFQIGLGATAMLTAIAFTLSISGRLPNLSYLTALDRMLVWSVLLVFLAIVEALATGLLAVNGHQALSRRIDRAARWGAPVLLLGGWLVIYLGTQTG